MTGDPVGSEPEEAQPRLFPRTWPKPIPGSYRFVFHRKSRLQRPSSYGARQFDIRGKCLVCGGRPDPLTPTECFCAPLSCARAYTCVRTREERGTK